MNATTVINQQAPPVVQQQQEIKKITVTDGSCQTEVIDDAEPTIEAAQPTQLVVPVPCKKCLEPVIAKLKMQQTNVHKKQRKNSGLLVICVYGSTVFVCVQLVALMLALNDKYTPPGLVFLITSLGYIGYIVFKVRKIKKISNT